MSQLDRVPDERLRAVRRRGHLGVRRPRERGETDDEQLETLAAATALWGARANEPISRHASWSYTHAQNRKAIVAMLDRQGVVYEDRRTQDSLSGAYRKGRKIAENDRSAFVSKTGEAIALSTLGELPAMPSLLAALTVIDTGSYYGHVAYVREVSGGRIYIDEGNWPSGRCGQRSGTKAGLHIAGFICR